MGKYKEDAKELLRLVGGRENIAAVTHCVTRMRFALQDPALADIKGIEAMKVVKGSFTQAGQFQVIIGTTVGEFYQDFVAIADLEGVSKDEVKKAAKLTTPWASLVPGMRSIHSGQPFQRRGISVNRSTTIMVASILDMR